MYYEEKIINGVLHWRSSPDGEWTAYSLEKLTKKLAGAQYQRDVFQAELAAAQASLDLQLKATQRARELWQDAHPGREGWPDQTALIVWLMKVNDQLEARQAQKPCPECGVIGWRQNDPSPKYPTPMLCIACFQDDTIKELREELAVSKTACLPVVADALAKLRADYSRKADGEGASIPWRAAMDLARQELDATITALGLGAKDESND